MTYAIEIENLQKSFGEVRAVDGLTFSVERGELFAFLGLNGAGKSTTIRMLCGILAPDGGTVRVEGETDRARYLPRLGVVYQDSALDKSLSLLDNLTSRAALYGITGQEFAARLKQLDELLEIAPLLKRPVGKLSGGQKRKADIARALIHHPDILILDEPTTGLDPQTRHTVWSALNSLRSQRQMTLFLTTHYMEEAADASHIVILDGGKIAAQGTPLELKNRFAGDSMRLYGVREKDVQALGVPYKPCAGGFALALNNTKQATDLILRTPALFTDYEVVKGGLDDVFLAATGKNLQGGEKA